MVYVNRGKVQYLCGGVWYDTGFIPVACAMSLLQDVANNKLEYAKGLVYMERL